MIDSVIFEEFLLKMGTHIRCIYGFYNHTLSLSVTYFEQKPSQLWQNPVKIVKNQHSCIRKNRNSVTALEEKMLLSNTEISKDIPQHLVCGDLSDDAAEVVDCFADVLGGEVGREAGGEAFADAEEGSAGIA